MEPDPLKRALRSVTAPPSDKVDGHLDPDTIAAIVDGQSPSRDVVAHLSNCAECRARVAVLAKLMDDPTIVAEIERLKPSTRASPARWSPSRWVTVTTLAAAAGLAVVLLGPERLGMRRAATADIADTHRDGTLTTTAPPRIISPLNVARRTDSLRWTSVTGADLYRVQIWNRDGTVVWSADTRTTSLPLPSLLIDSGGAYLWEVKARTGWDRWVSSDFLEFTIQPGSVR